MSETYDPGDHTVDEVKEYVGDNPDQADEVLAAEKAGKNRSTLVEWLESESAGPQTAEEIAVAEHALEEESMEALAQAEAPPEIEASQLPPALAGIGLVGIRALTSGIVTAPSGATYNLSPGIAFAVSPEDARALTEQGLVVSEV